MLAKLCVFAAAIPLALGLTLNAPPANVTSGLVTTVSWSATSSDPPFTLELFHPSFNNALALANNINPSSASSLSVEMPIVPADSGYTLEAVNIGNISDVYSVSPSFSIAQTPSTVASASFSTTFSLTGSSSSGVSATATSSSVTGSSSSAGSVTSAATSAAGTSGSFNGAMPFKSCDTGALAAILATIAGANFLL